MAAASAALSTMVAKTPSETCREKSHEFPLAAIKKATSPTPSDTRQSRLRLTGLTVEELAVEEVSIGIHVCVIQGAVS